MPRSLRVAHIFQHQLHDVPELGTGQLLKDHDFIDTIQEFRANMSFRTLCTLLSMASYPLDPKPYPLPFERGPGI